MGITKLADLIRAEAPDSISHRDISDYAGNRSAHAPTQRVEITWDPLFPLSSVSMLLLVLLDAAASSCLRVKFICRANFFKSLFLVHGRETILTTIRFIGDFVHSDRSDPLT